MTTSATLYDPRLNARLKQALLMAMILHAVLFIALGIRAILVDDEPPRGPLTVQLAKGLADRIPDKRKAAALEVERLA